MRKQKILSCFLTLVIFLVAPLNVYATQISSEMPYRDGDIPADVYELIEEYKNGTYSVGTNDKNGIAQALFEGTADEADYESKDADVKKLYNLKKVAENTFEATQVSLYSLENTTQGQMKGVIIYNRITYNTKSFNGDPWNYVMLTKVSGGVVQNNGNYWCEALYLRYHVYGDAFSETGTHVGYKGADSGYGNQIYAPSVGTNYSRSGPSDYYYSLGYKGTALSGFTKGTIRFRLGASEELVTRCAINAI